ncbi:PRKC apoptosis WT1 regulator protein [Apodemus sylvaticus]|uniref:PRKC apoptosis WT1 regulator protein n=1 Tax=Apodemus sylvaticus TaxID=10129 RepID=UPI00224360D8|nr:PRKC apoptosis WT1 regulator protein [Apodemus sylvaticus]
MATGGYRSSGSTTDFLEEWKAKREKMRAKQNPAGPGSSVGDPAAKSPAGSLAPNTAAGTSELNHGLAGAAAPAAPGPGALNCAHGSAALPRAAPGSRRAEDECPSAAAAAGAPTSRGDEEEPDSAPEKGRSSGPSARKGKGQIEKRKLREKRRSTGVVNIPAAECLDEYEDDEAGQKERKREDALTQHNTIQNEAATLPDPGTSYLSQDPSRTVPGRYKSTSSAPEDEISNRYPRADRSAFSRHNRDANAPPANSASSSTLEKRIEDLEKEVVRERQENLRLVRLMQDKEEMIGKLKEEIDLLNRDLDDMEDENEQLKQENKTLLKVVGQLTR